MIGIGVGIGRSGSMAIGGLSVEAIAWEARIVANGGTILPATLQIFDTHFFRPAVLNGSILTELDRLNVYCGLVGYEIAARTNLIKSAHFVTPVSSPTFDNNGYKSAGTGYLNLNYDRAIHGDKNGNTDNNFGCVVDGVTYAVDRNIIGGAVGARNQFLQRFTTPRVQAANNSNNTQNASNAPTGRIFIASTKSSATAGTIIVNDTVTVATFTDFSNVNTSQFELTYAVSGSPAGNYDTNYHLCSHHGSNSLAYAAFKAILINLFTALGV